MESTDVPQDTVGRRAQGPSGLEGTTRPSRRTVLGLGSLAVAGLAGCTKATTPEDLPSSAAPSATIVKDLEFRFGTPAAPATLDPALAADNESFRITRQVFESLVGVDPDTGAPTPGLATEWKTSDDGLVYTFTLRQGVTFHDGTEFNAHAVVYNFKRWADLPPDLGGQPGRAFEAVFHHHEVQPAEDSSVAPDTKSATASDAPASDAPSTGKKADTADAPDAGKKVETVSASYYQTCRAADTYTFVLTLTKPITALIQALTLPGFGIASPSALRKFKADEASHDKAGRIVTRFGKHPVGTGPYKYRSGDGSSSELVANTKHWRHRTQIGKASFHVLRDPLSRLLALRQGTVAAYDMVTVGELRDLVREGQQVLQRDPFSVLYLGVNRANPLLKQDKIRRAMAHAIDRQKLIDTYFIAGTKEAKSFVPPSLGVPNGPTYYGYDPSKATELLKESTYDGESIPFSYPLNVTRAYLPLPEQIYATLSAQLTAVGFNIEPHPIDWEDGYLESVTKGRDPGFHLLGWNGGYRDPDNFIGTLFGTTSSEFTYEAPALRAKIVTARSMPNGDARAAVYQEIGEQLTQDIPALPLAYPISAVAADDSVLRYPTSPTLDEPFDRVTLTT
ncbi:ABC transporter substrate-binding protein [Arthrobacter rhombi]|uniref:ABC transporter substrate-binding protein n=1 Tax=Arthrobacter rhombi TaxID=71253 RepID=UPI0031DA4250